jgi:DNA-binding NtrC family response regulator
MNHILVISRSHETFRDIRSGTRHEYAVEHAVSRDIALRMLRERHYAFIFFDLEILRESAAGNGYKAAFQPFWYAGTSARIIVMATPEHIREAVMAVKAGADNYLTYPVSTDELKYLTENTYESLMPDHKSGDDFWQRDSLQLVKTRSPEMKKVFGKIRSVAPIKSTVLLIGETGTGKGVLARLIHRHSNRKDAHFVSVHCGAIPDTLLESELFGHEKGSFTGAIRRKPGKFEIADQGTIFLDEIGTVTPSAQIKLLQILQDGTLSRVGGEEVIETNVRVIAATNSDLKKMSDEGQFRRDLYYRLNVFPLQIPSLRERLEDISFFAEMFLKKLNRLHPKEIHDIHPQVSEAFKKYSWPGNIRELENIMERAYILESSSVLTPESFPSELFESASAPAFFSLNSSMPLGEARRKGIEDVERHYLKELLSRNKGKIKSSADDAEISTRQLHKLLKKYNIHKEDFK